MSIEASIARGVAFLESVQLPSGEIPIEIDGGIREPCVFPAALAARALSIAPAADRVRARMLDFLQREVTPDGLWRHPSSAKPDHYGTPLDLDDTALASTALRAAGQAVPDNRAILLAHRERNGLFRTWIVRWWPHPILTWRFFRWVARPDDVDAVVNANVVLYLGDCDETRPAIEHLLAVLRANRELESTIWYGSRLIVWYFFSHALREIAPEAGELIVPRVEAATPANAMERALAISTLQLWNRATGVKPLIDAQLPSGAWPAAGFYHMGFRPGDAQPKRPWWGSEALTTVFAIEALSRRST